MAYGLTTGRNRSLNLNLTTFAGVKVYTLNTSHLNDLCKWIVSYCVLDLLLFVAMLEGEELNLVRGKIL